MVLLPVDARPFLKPLRSELSGLLASLAGADWGRPTSCPGWSVHGVASHLLGGEVGNVSARRDGWLLSPGPGADFDAWLNEFNQLWVSASRRISPALLTELLGIAGRRFEEQVSVLDMHAPGGSVRWATGDDPAPIWLDIAREYMERYVHQQQIRDAVGAGSLSAELTAPALTVAAHALPLALATVVRPPGTVVSFTASGDGGGSWYLIRAESGWDLSAVRPAEPAACAVRTTVAGAVKRYVRDPAAPPLDWDGDAELAAAVAQVKAVLG
jgi:uncharacterized protein (TIGR03083 family)